MGYDFVEELKRVGALKEGHFLLSSGRHSDQYVEKFDLLRNPSATERACEELAGRLCELGPVDLVAGPTTGGILLAFEIARQLGVLAAYAERAREGAAEREFKRGTVIEPGTRVLVVDDIMTTGGSVHETIDALHKLSAEVAGVAILVDRSEEPVDFGGPLVSLAKLEIQSWAPDDVPAWLQAVPITKPGTSAVGGTG